MRFAFAVIFFIVAVVLAVCGIIARRSSRPSSIYVSRLLFALIPPVIGNMIIIQTGNKTISTVGSYIYFLGMDVVMAALLIFALDYCRINWKGKKPLIILSLVLLADMVQLLLNLQFRHAFRTLPVIVDGYAYYRLVPFAGQRFHRILDYAIFFAVLILFIVKTKRTPKIYAERYLLILISMFIVGGWNSFYILSRSPVDRSMIGYGVFGLLVFYFTIFYRPVRLLDNMLAELAQEMNDAVFLFDASNLCVWANNRGIDLIGVEEDQYEPVGPRLKAMFGSLEGSGNWTSERIIGSGEDKRYYTLERREVNRSGSSLTVHDGTEERREIEQKIYTATHDSLTDLYTREELYNKIVETIEADPRTTFNIVYLDVDDFKLSNDLFGTDFGDKVLIKIADWIRGVFREKGVYGRLFGDKFGICIPESDFDEEKIESDLSHFIVEKESMRYALSVHLGVYTMTDRSVDVSVMFDWAHMALNTIKKNMHAHVAYYTDQMRQSAIWNRQIETDLQRGIKNRELTPYLQPLLDRKGRVVGAEALVRWQHPEKGFLMPGQFIRALESNGLIAMMDKYMWESACEILARWKNDLFISVNISPKDFYFLDVAEEIKALARKYGIAPHRLRLEITETVMMTDLENRVAILNELRAEGFIIEMDDFGNGYSSLSLLKDIPVDVLKIDMNFLRDSVEKTRSNVIVNSIIKMSEDLGMDSLTEGVETEDQYKILADMGCKMFQGYYFGKPMPVESFEREWVS